MARHWNQSKFYCVRFEVLTEVTIKGWQLLISLTDSLNIKMGAVYPSESLTTCTGPENDNPQSSTLKCICYQLFKSVKNFHNMECKPKEKKLCRFN
jgi:hypothetical protein